MTDPTTPPMNNDNTNGTNDSPIPQGDDLDLLLREWHDAHGSRAGELKDELMARVRQRTPGVAGRIEHPAGARRSRRHSWTTGAGVLAAAALVMLLTVGLVFKQGLAPIGPGNGTGIHANFLRVCDVPAGGRLEALDARGMVIGVCPLQHTDVTVDVTGFVARVTLEQRYANPYDDKIEGVYTFPMSQDGAVDRMEMIVGDRVVVGEVKERELARKVYEAAKNANRVAALLEQERPNIFTQSVANIEPGHEVTVRISYVEMLERSDGVFSFDFPMVVAPRYIPGSTSLAPQDHDPQGLIFGCEHRRGLVMLAPGAIELAQPGNVEHLGEVSQDRLLELIERAKPVTPPTIIDGPASVRTDPWYRFMIRYADGAVEAGVIDSNGLGQLGGRWFQADLTTLRPVSAPVRPGAGAEPGAPFEANTDQVPDASRITPMPVPPGQRAGHDISITVNIDTGGPGITSIDSRLHKVQRTDGDLRADGLPTQTTITLAGGKTIPNKDFILAWEQSADTVEHASFVHSGDLGGFMSVIVEPPARINDAHAAPRELIFVLDTSGSMSGFPIEKAKAVMIRAMSELRPQDTFNVITFAGSTQILWDKPRPGSEANVAEAQGFINGKSGGGGTEMMTAINAALKQGNPEQPVLSADELLELPCDGRQVVVSLRSLNDSGRKLNFIASPGAQAQPFADWLKAYLTTARIGPGFWNNTIKGRWAISAGEPTLIFDGWGEAHTAPIRIVCFMTDGHVGNDMAIIDAVKNNRQTTRVFSFGIGNAPNRYLLTSMAKAGLGEAEFVTLDDNADAKAMRFAERIRTPVLTHVELEFGPGLAMEDAVSPNAIAPLERLDEQNVIRLGIPDGAVYRVPDLFDQRPVIVHARFQKTRPNLNETTITLRGRNAQGPFERTFTIDLPDAGEAPEHDVVPTLWARQKVEALMNQDLKAAQSGAVDADTKGQIVALGERFSIVTQFTSFVAVDMARVTIDGTPRLVHIPIEMPDGMSWQGVFGGEMPRIRNQLAREAQLGGYDVFYTTAAVEQATAAQFGQQITGSLVAKQIVDDALGRGLLDEDQMRDADPTVLKAVLMNSAVRQPGWSSAQADPAKDFVDKFTEYQQNLGAPPTNERLTRLHEAFGQFRDPSASPAGDAIDHAPEQGASGRFARKSGVAGMRTSSGTPVLDLDSVLQQSQTGGGGGASQGIFQDHLALDGDIDTEDMDILLGDFGSVATDLNLYPSDVVGGSTAGYVGFIQDPADPANFTIMDIDGTITIGGEPTPIGTKVFAGVAIPSPDPLSIIPVQQGSLDLINADGAGFEGIYESKEAAQAGLVSSGQFPARRANETIISLGSALAIDTRTSTRAISPAAPPASSAPILGDIPLVGDAFRNAPDESAKVYHLAYSDPNATAELLRRTRGLEAVTATLTDGTRGRVTYALPTSPPPPPAKAVPARPRAQEAAPGTAGADRTNESPDTEQTRPQPAAELAGNVPHDATTARAVTAPEVDELIIKARELAIAGKSIEAVEVVDQARARIAQAHQDGSLVEGEARDRLAGIDRSAQQIAIVARYEHLHPTPDLVGATVLKDGVAHTLPTIESIVALVSESAAKVDAWSPELESGDDGVKSIDTARGHHITATALNMLRLARLKGEGAAGSDGDDGSLGARVLDACEIAIRASQPHKARAWCDSLRRLNVAEAPLAARVYAALTDESLEPDARSAAAVALIDALQARVAEVARHVKIAHTLPAELRGESADEPGDGPIRVSVLTSSLDEPALSAMRAAGLTVDGVSNTAGLVVGSIDRASLESLAALDVVRWIEPTRAREVGLAPAAR